MPDLSPDDAAVLLRFVLDQLTQQRADEVIDGIVESRRAGIEEKIDRKEVPSATVGMVRRRPPTDLEMLHIVFERLHQRLIVLPAVARSMQRHLASREIVWRVDRDFVAEDRVSELEASIVELLPDGIGDILPVYKQVNELMPAIVPPTTQEHR
jgi:hypothetical protein